MERTSFTIIKTESYCDPSPVEQLLRNGGAMDELLRIQRGDHNYPLPLSANLRELLTSVYDTFKPISDRLIEKRIRRFTRVDSDTENNIRAEQDYHLWKIVVLKFHWENYHNANHAAGAFIIFLKRSTGSFFAEDIIRDQKTSRQSKIRRAAKPLVRPVEEAVIRRENSNKIRNTWRMWQNTTLDIYVKAVEKRYLNRKSIEEQAKEENAKIGTIKMRLIRGKKKLFAHLEEAEILSADELLTGKLVVGQNTRKELLEKRRMELKNKLSLWEISLATKPKLRKALVTFYGLNGHEPLYDYKKTAEITGIPFESVRVLVPEGVRLMLGNLSPSLEAQEHQERTQQFIYWTQHRKELQLSGSEEELLRLKFEEEKSNLEIANIMHVSEETVRRQTIRTLGLIETVMSTYHNEQYCSTTEN
jgi:DNA-directed RNA polymerase specialized sigma24 family protein